MTGFPSSPGFPPGGSPGRGPAPLGPAPLRRGCGTRGHHGGRGRPNRRPRHWPEVAGLLRAGRRFPRQRRRRRRRRPGPADISGAEVCAAAAGGGCRHFCRPPSLGRTPPVPAARGTAPRPGRGDSHPLPVAAAAGGGPARGLGAGAPATRGAAGGGGSAAGREANPVRAAASSPAAIPAARGLPGCGGRRCWGRAGPWLLARSLPVRWESKKTQTKQSKKPNQAIAGVSNGAHLKGPAAWVAWAALASQRLR